MNLKLAIASSIALIAASASFADSPDYHDFSNFVSTKSRAEVIAELEAARADGTLQVLESQYPVIAQNPGVRKSREEVLAELKQFRAEHPNFNYEVNYPDVFQATPARQRVAGMESPSSSR